MGALAAYTVTGAGKNAVAQEPPVTARESSVLVNPQALFVRRYEIAAGPLGTVLEQFEKVAGVGITAAQPAVLSIQSPGVSGLYTVDQALQKILADTALDYSYSRDGTVQGELAFRFGVCRGHRFGIRDFFVVAQVPTAARGHTSDRWCGFPADFGSAGSDNIARRPTQRGGNQSSRGRRRIARRQPDDSGVHCAQRSLHRRYA
jgi:hypothetical protein